MDVIESKTKRPHNLPEFRVDPIVVLLLSFITCGLYLIYWNMKVAEVINAANNKEVISNGLAIFAGIGCCLPVSVYFYYILGRDGLPKIHQMTGNLEKDQSTLLLVLGLFFPFAAAMIVQSELNHLYD